MLKNVFKVYENKLYKSKLAEHDSCVMGFLDARLQWNQKHRFCEILEKVFQSLNINALIFSQPSQPYRLIIDYLANNSNGIITPRDTESRTFLHDLPVLFKFDPPAIISALKKRKSVILPGHGMITHGTVGLEQAFVTFSSVCFACFVKFFSDYLFDTKHGKLDKQQKKVFEEVIKELEPAPSFNGFLKKGPFDSENNVYSAMAEAGRLVVENRLVDSIFGNISFCYNKALYISQTGSSLDDLRGCIDKCPLDGSSCAPITASSEISTHLDIVNTTDLRAILHGHPKFAVILSMDCDIDKCRCKDRCHQHCPFQRSVGNIPIVSGEVGTGPHGLCNTVPAAIENKPGVIVYGHGLFTTGKTDFNRPFKNLVKIENICRKEYFKRLKI